MKGDRGDVVDAFPRFLIQGLDVAESVRETQAGSAHLMRRQSIKHEGIVGVRAVRDLDLAKLAGCTDIDWILWFRRLLSSELLGASGSLAAEAAFKSLVRRQRVAMPAANITLKTSAAMNQYRPKYAAFASECVKM